MRFLRLSLRIAVIILALAALVLFLIPTRHTFTEKSLSATVTVLDSATSAPIPGASVTLHSAQSNSDPLLHPPPSWSTATTDSAGRATVSSSFAIESTFLHHRALVERATITADAPSYRAAAPLPLAETALVEWRFLPPAFHPAIRLQKHILNEFVGLWYSKVGHDNDVFGTDAFTCLNIHSDGTYAFDIILLMPSDQPKTIALRFVGPVGKWTENPSDHLTFQSTDQTGGFEANYANSHIAILSRNPDSKSDTIMYRENEAPWAKIEIHDMPREKK